MPGSAFAGSVTYSWMRKPSLAAMWKADISAISSGLIQGLTWAMGSAVIVATSTSRNCPGSRSPYTRTSALRSSTVVYISSTFSLGRAASIPCRILLSGCLASRKSYEGRSGWYSSATIRPVRLSSIVLDTGIGFCATSLRSPVSIATA